MAAPDQAERLLAEAEALIDMRAPLVVQIPKLTRDQVRARAVGGGCRGATPTQRPASDVTQLLPPPPPAQYLVWAHTPHHYAAPPKHARLFVSDAWEALSKTAWWAVPAVWLPVAAALWVPYATSPGASPAGAAGLAALGLLLWSLVEYSLHRFLFHADDRLPDHPAARQLHFLLHGVHHRVPLDRLRLVMPPALTAVLAAALYAAFRAALPVGTLLGAPAWHALFASGLAGYVAYDVCHYAQHHAPAAVPWWAAAPARYVWRMRRIHMRHHFQGAASERGFGVTSTLWDHVFGTALLVPELPSRPAAAGAAAAAGGGGHAGPAGGGGERVAAGDGGPVKPEAL